MNNKEMIIKIIQDDTNLMLGDVKTFIWLRSVQLNAYKNQKTGVGGGNFLMVLGCFSVLYFIAKIYFLLKYGKNPENVFERIFKKLYRIISGDNKSASKFIDERKALKYFLKKSNIWVLSNNMLNQVREYYRNSLAHTGLPKRPIFSIEYVPSKKLKEIKFKDVENFLDSKKESPFSFKNNKITSINADLFYRDVRKMQKWLIEQIKIDIFKKQNLNLLEVYLSERNSD